MTRRPPRIHGAVIVFIFLVPFSSILPCQSAMPRCPDVLPTDSQAITPRIINGNENTRPGSPLVLSSPADPTIRRCTGVRLSPMWAITAAHCNISPQWDVLASTTSALEGLPLSIDAVFMHPNYTSTTARRFDVAVFRLTGPPGPSIPLATDVSLPKPGAYVRVSGFGTDPANDFPATTLRHADIPVVSHARCASAYAGSANLGVLDSRRQVCAGFPDGVCDACSGDSGGPVTQFTKDGTPVLVAIISASAGCAKPGFPGINVRIAPLIPWLNDLGVDFATASPEQVFIPTEESPPPEADGSTDPTRTPEPSTNLHGSLEPLVSPSVSMSVSVTVVPSSSSSSLPSASASPSMSTPTLPSSTPTASSSVTPALPPSRTPAAEPDDDALGSPSPAASADSEDATGAPSAQASRAGEPSAEATPSGGDGQEPGATQEATQEGAGPDGIADTDSDVDGGGDDVEIPVGPSTNDVDGGGSTANVASTAGDSRAAGAVMGVGVGGLVVAGVVTVVLGLRG